MERERERERRGTQLGKAETGRDRLRDSRRQAETGGDRRRQTRRQAETGGDRLHRLAQSRRGTRVGKPAREILTAASTPEQWSWCDTSLDSKSEPRFSLLGLMHLFGGPH